MPFYEYQCAACGRVSEVMQKISDVPLKKCPECGKAKLQKLVSAPVFRLAGSGWYETDFKGDSDKKRNLAGADKEPESKPASDAKTETKAEATPAESTKSEPAKPASKPTARHVTRRAAAKKTPAKKKARR